MRGICCVAAILCLPALLGEIIDRTVAVVGRQVITASEIESQLRLQAMFNGEPVNLSSGAREAALERLIEQRLIAGDIALADLAEVAPDRITTAMHELRGSDFAGLGYEQALEAYQVAESEVRDFLRRQLEFTRYVEFRFAMTLEIADEEIESRYQELFAGFAEPPALELVREQIRSNVAQVRAERALRERVKELRSETRIVILEPLETAGTEGVA